MAISSTEFRQLLKDVQSLTAQSRADGNTNTSIRGQLEALLPQLQQAESEGYTGAAAAIEDVNLYVRLITQKSETPAAQPQPSQTVAQVVTDDGPQGPTKQQQQQVDNTSGTSGRVVTTSAATAPSNADTVTTTNNGGSDAGTNPSTTTLNESQAITPRTGPVPVLKVGTYDANGRLLSQEEIWGKPTTSGGVGAKGDDSIPAVPVTTQSIVNTASAGKITPLPNVLDKFASYTYNASVYLLTPTQYSQLLHSKKKKINGYNLLFQSGGAPNNVGGFKGSAGSTGPDAGRNPAFTQDFYIDSITMQNDLPGKITGAAHMVTDLKFTVVEPNGITLLDRLYQAVQDHVPKTGTGAINYTAVTYLMVIRFYGYDQNGVLIGGSSGSDTNKNDNNAVIEKFIPFIITGVDWGVSNKLVTYDFKCAPTGQLVGGSTNRGTIPYDIELSDSSLAGLLAGDVKYNSKSATASKPGGSTTTNTNKNADAQREAAASQSASPTKSSAAPSSKKTITQGLMGAMNEFQKSLVQEGVYQYADEYYIEFADQDLAAATIVLPGTQKNKAASPQAQAPTQDAQNLLQEKVSMNLSVRNFTITAGQQILQAIELAVRNSSYVSNQALTITDEQTGKTYPNPNARNKPFEWFQISMQAEPKSAEYDKKRNDYAYKITFTISKYQVPNFDSTYFPTTKFPGIHKSYNYWFTGQNTAVLDYQANFNSLYTITVTGTDPKNSGAAAIKRAYTSSMRDIPKFNYSARSTENTTGAKNAANETAANAAEYLYDPSSLGETKLRIIGDPAWIQQGSLFAGVSATEFNYSPFLADGTINFDSRQVLFEIAWQRPEDYSLSTGLADPYSRTQKTTGDRQPIQSYVYQATSCTSEFKQGRFEQTISGSLYFFPNDKGTNTAPTAPATGAALAGAASGADRADASKSNVLSRLQAAIPSSANSTNTAPNESEPRSNTEVQDQTSTVKGVTAAPSMSELVPSRSNDDAQTTTEASPPALQQAASANPVTSNGATVEPVATFSAPPKIGQPTPRAIINETNLVSKDGGPG